MLPTSGPQGPKMEVKMDHKVAQNMTFSTKVRTQKKTTPPVYNHYFSSFGPPFWQPFGYQNPTPNAVPARLLPKVPPDGQRSHTYRFGVDFGRILTPHLGPGEVGNEPGFASLVAFWAALGAIRAPRPTPRTPETPFGSIWANFGRFFVDFSPSFEHIWVEVWSFFR